MSLEQCFVMPGLQSFYHMLHIICGFKSRKIKSTEIDMIQEDGLAILIHILDVRN
jgi:hypothetical protein